MDLAKIKPDETLDVRGISCPMPTLKTAKAMKSLEVGQIPKLARKSGHEWLGFLDDEEGFFRFYLKKGEKK
jgi:tRNA 2-thiouridine synthesizing protein A